MKTSKVNHMPSVYQIVSDKSEVVCLRRNGLFQAVWRGILAPHDFTSKGAAQAYIDSCNAAGKIRA